MAGNEILTVEGLARHFTPPVSVTDRLFGKKPVVNRAVDGVDLVLHKGETLGLVGESGCGKSTLARSIVGLYGLTAGAIRYDGELVQAKRTRAQRLAIQMVFQDPFSSLNPRMTVEQTLSELLRFHKLVPRNKVGERNRELMDLVGLPERALKQRPRQFSGGQRQRVGIARALALEPTVLIADEPVSALDVSVQANIINLLTDLQERLHLSVIFVSHNMAVVRQISDRTAVMYRGRIVETGETETLFDDPVHPYTKLLISSVPRLAEAGDVVEPDAVAAESGVEAAGENPMLAEIIGSAARGGTSPCRYADRCPAVVAACAVEPSLIVDPRDSGRSAACVHVAERKGVVA
ncbi:peptide/nickel transport system ATP-binding protein/oligopeptide transport system ATP-binding protein [Streptosporangium subroseum]|uniref:Peptide/nickel transport system ATP-binding protein/oligopeptide transport system ATP-binding protein n=1 Tax=Streptosporangium subroseum TaxID=106412 RepID=A0A239P096_9ACTN|nr:oligopeptide/dipeptide ABC transporter ATP-binding protein [Streptosporangium subroseum]SNT60058.1 peptide/nickel transport system ATP-binding protein/oligopeptide transport system ATP-binding protein [Streptosporangium subroseum]